MSSLEKDLEERERREADIACADPRLNVALPAAPESEECLLSMLMNSPGEVWQEFTVRLKSPLFHHPARLTMFMMVEELHTSGRALEVTTFTGMLRQRNELDLVGGAAEVSRMWGVLPIPSRSQVDHHLGVLEEMQARRGMIKAAWGMVAAARDTMEPWKAAIEKAEGDLFNLHEQTSRRGTRHIREVLPGVVGEIQTAYERMGHVGSGMQLGLTDLDRVTMGLKTGLFVIAARPSKGKTVLGCQLAINVGCGVGHYDEFDQSPLPVLFFSLETTDRALTRRMLFNQWTVPISEARNGTISRANQDKLQTAVMKLQNAPIYLHESFGMSIQELRATARMQIARHGIKLIIVDYLQLLTSSSKAAQYSRQAMIAEVSTGLKHLAHEFDIPVIALAQLNREGDGPRPSMADLRESGQIEQDADYIAMICDAPEEVTNPGGDEDDLPSEDQFMGLDLVKNKDGPTTSDGPPIVLYFDKTIFRLRSWTDSLLSNNTAKYAAGYTKNTKAVQRKAAAAAERPDYSKGKSGGGAGAARPQWNGRDYVEPGHPSLRPAEEKKLDL